MFPHAEISGDVLCDEETRDGKGRKGWGRDGEGEAVLTYTNKNDIIL